MTKRYDQSYFDRWYRHPAHRVMTPSALRRKVQVVVAIAEYFLRREIRSVLDVGCGEAPWFVELRRLRPAASYLGLDPSDYVVSRFGRARNVRKAAFGDVGDLVDGRYDLIICSDVLHYVDAPELERGLAAVAGVLQGVAFLEVLTKEDLPCGDLTGFHSRPAAFYRRLFARFGLVPCGVYCYLGPELAEAAAALEKC